MSLFVSIEGFDGVGKTTQANLLNEYLKNEGIKSILVREPGGTSVAEKIREILIADSELSPITELLLFESARSDLVNKLIREKLENDFIVITDRYLDSTLAYQGYGRNIDKSIINELNKFSTENLYPDITFLLDLKVEEANKRTKKRKDTNNKDQILKFENEENIFHQKIRDGFLEIAKNNKDRINIIDASLDQKEILKLIIEKVLRKLNL
ncbi:MAG: dTMP kinase [Dehalococcoidia bacterium]|nr:dTMP kinase [Chloroflexota bacterium]